MEPFLGEIRLFCGNFTPAGWQACDGSLLQISNNDALFTLLGTYYGGDGQSTFGVPDLRGRVPLHQGTLQSEPTVSYTIGQSGGDVEITLTANQIPAHSHALCISAAPGTVADPTGAVFATIPDDCTLFFEATPSIALDSRLVSTAGLSMAHDNMQPYTVLSYIIATAGVYPSQG